MKFSIPDKKYTFAMISLFVVLCIATLLFGNLGFYKYIFLGWIILLWFSGNFFGYKGYRVYFDKFFALIMILSGITLFLLLKVDVPSQIYANAFKLSFSVFLTGEAILKQIGLPPQGTAKSK